MYTCRIAKQKQYLYLHVVIFKWGKSNHLNTLLKLP